MPLPARFSREVTALTSPLMVMASTRFLRTTLIGAVCSITSLTTLSKQTYGAGRLPLLIFVCAFAPVVLTMILSNSTHVSTEIVYETRSPWFALMRVYPASKSSATDKETNGPLGPFCSRIVTIRTDSLFPGVIGELISALLSVVHSGRDDLRLYAAFEAFVLLPSCLTVGSRTFNVDPITRHSGVVCKKKERRNFFGCRGQELIGPWSP